MELVVDVTFSTDGVAAGTMNWKPGKVPGPDQIPSK